MADNTSEYGVDDMFRAADSTGTGPPRGGRTATVGRTPVGARSIEREAPARAMGFGRGPMPQDDRKFRYDIRRGAMEAINLPFSVSKADRLDASEAGDLLHRIHQAYGIENESEGRIAVFDKALFFEHTINGASLLQPGRGIIEVAGMKLDVKFVKEMLGNNQRRFFRAYADEIAAVNQEVIDKYDPYDSISAEKYQQLRQVAAERGLQKFPSLAHDSSDAGSLSFEERVAVIASKNRKLPGGVVNSVDMHPEAQAPVPVVGGY